MIGYAAMSKWARRAADESLDSRASVETARSRVSEGSAAWTRREESPKTMMGLHNVGGNTGGNAGGSGRPEQRRASSSPVKSVRKIVVKLQAIPPHFRSPEVESEGLYQKALRVLGSDASRKAKVSCAHTRSINKTNLSPEVRSAVRRDPHQ